MSRTNKLGIDATMIIEAADGNLASMGRLIGKLEPEADRIANSLMKEFGLEYDYHSTQDIAQGILIDFSRYIQEDFLSFWEQYRGNMGNGEGR